MILSRSGLGLLSVPPSFFPDVFATITLIHKQITAMAGYYACGAFINIAFYSFLSHIRITITGVILEILSALFLFCVDLLLFGTAYLKLSHFPLCVPLAEFDLVEIAA